ncbi:MAG: phosphatase PAP2 family protein [Candidatus Thermoplasmatota archaeon]|nr:phosphatase PAP2 family protein [Candidatus Thermoplasmatota archaeon]
MSPYWVMMGLILIMTPIICWLFSRNQRDTCVPMDQVFDEIGNKRYYLHVFGYLAIFIWKKVTDGLNEPIKTSTGHYTDWVHGFEGEFVFWIQNTFQNPLFTDVLNFHYLFIYLFLIYVTTIYYMYTGERDLTDKVTLNYLLIYALAVPYYLFFNVEVTSSYIPGMDALLYQDPWYAYFYGSHDPLDNCVPSLHIAIPFGILALNWLHMRENGIKLKEWKHRRYHQFIFWNTVLFAFAILYLGIHWIIDIPLGILIGGIGALFIHHIQPRLRNDFGATFKGFSKGKTSQHAFVEGIVVLLMVSILLASMAYQEDTLDERASMRLGPGDSNIDVIQELVPEQEAIFILTNMDDEFAVEVVIIELYDASKAMDVDGIIWEEINEQAITIAPGETHQFPAIDDKKYWHLAVVHLNDTAEGVVSVHITVEYTGEDLVTTSLIMSLPSMWMTGWVLHRLCRLKLEGRDWVDSTPSHSWINTDHEE